MLEEGGAREALLVVASAAGATVGAGLELSAVHVVVTRDAALPPTVEDEAARTTLRELRVTLEAGQ